MHLDNMKLNCGIIIILDRLRKIILHILPRSTTLVTLRTHKKKFKDRLIYKKCLHLPLI